MLWAEWGEGSPGPWHLLLCLPGSCHSIPVIPTCSRRLWGLEENPHPRRAPVQDRQAALTAWAVGSAGSGTGSCVSAVHGDCRGCLL